MKIIMVGMILCAGILYGAEKKDKPPRVTTSQMEELFKDPAMRAAVIETEKKSQESRKERKKKRAEASAAKFVFARKPRAKTLPATRSAPDIKPKAPPAVVKEEKPATPPSPSVTTDVPAEDTAPGGRPELFSNMGWKQY